MVNSSAVPAMVVTRPRIVLWRAEGRQKQEVAALAGVPRPTVDLWLRRFGDDGIVGLLDRARGASREQVPAATRWVQVTPASMKVVMTARRIVSHSVLVGS